MMIKVYDLDRKLTESFVTFCCEDLKIFPKLIEVSPIKFDTDSTGLCIDVDEDEFLILTKTKDRNLTQIYKTIAHELVHVKQFIYDNLNDLLLTNEPYETCWWEKEAQEKSTNLISRYVKLMVDIRQVL